MMILVKLKYMYTKLKCDFFKWIKVITNNLELASSNIKIVHIKLKPLTMLPVTHSSP